VPVKSYEYGIFIPLYHNDGTPIDIGAICRFQNRLLDEFGGLTVFPQPNQGYWRMGEVTYCDEIIIFRVVATSKRSARRFLRPLKAEIKRILRQEEILIIERDVDTL
jgi:hypothetical protein